MNLQDQLWIVVLILILVVILATLWIAYRIQRWWSKRRGTVNRKRGKRAEHEARKLLERKGYKVLDEQPHFTHTLCVNGVPLSFDVNPDLLVRRDGIDYVVEVKNCNESSGVNNAAIRRQVIEYLRATGLPCLLVNMPEGRIDLIED